MHGRDFDYLGALFEGRRGPVTPSRFVSERTSPKNKAAKQGQLGTVEQCLPGDIVCAGTPKHCTWVDVSWEIYDGAVMGRPWDPVRRKFDLGPNGLRKIPKGTTVRFLGVRPK